MSERSTRDAKGRINYVPGRWRPVQGLLQAYAVFSGLRGLIFGPSPGQPLESMTKNAPPVFSIVFFALLLIGGVVAIAGEMLQLRCPVLNPTPEKFKDFVTGQLIERCGDLIITLNYGAYAIAIIESTAVVASRSYPYIFIALGFLGRCGQLFLENRRMRQEGVIK